MKSGWIWWQISLKNTCSTEVWWEALEVPFWTPILNVCKFIKLYRCWVWLIWGCSILSCKCVCVCVLIIKFILKRTGSELYYRKTDRFSKSNWDDLWALDQEGTIKMSTSETCRHKVLPIESNDRGDQRKFLEPRMTEIEQAHCCQLYSSQPARRQHHWFLPQFSGPLPCREVLCLLIKHLFLSLSTCLMPYSETQEPRKFQLPSRLQRLLTLKQLFYLMCRHEHRRSSEKVKTQAGKSPVLKLTLGTHHSDVFLWRDPLNLLPSSPGSPACSFHIGQAFSFIPCGSREAPPCSECWLGDVASFHGMARPVPSLQNTSWYLLMTTGKARCQCISAKKCGRCPPGLVPSRLTLLGGQHTLTSPWAQKQKS